MKFTLLFIAWLMLGDKHTRLGDWHMGDRPHPQLIKSQMGWELGWGTEEGLLYISMYHTMYHWGPMGISWGPHGARGRASWNARWRHKPVWPPTHFSKINFCSYAHTCPCELPAFSTWAQGWSSFSQLDCWEYWLELCQFSKIDGATGMPPCGYACW